MPLFPLGAVAVLPQQVVPLHIFEPRYRQMIEHALDGAGQIAMAVLARSKTLMSGTPGSGSGATRPPRLRKAVCVCQIVQHEKQADGRYNLMVQGICRAVIAEEEPASPERLYRRAMLEPIGLENHDTDELAEIREHLETSLRRPVLSKLVGVKPVLEYLADERIPTSALMELVTFSMVHDAELRYRLLAEGDIEARSKILLSELGELAKLLLQAEKQRGEAWPKGCSWN